MLCFRKGVTIKIVQHYKEIIDYLWFVSDKFDDHMNNVSTNIIQWRIQRQPGGGGRGNSFCLLTGGKLGVLPTFQAAI